MRLFGIIGKPLGHSFSQRYFTEKFKREGITDCRYEPFQLDTIGELPALLQKHPDLCGLNVTIPYKQQVCSYLDDTSHLPLPACNCIRIVNGKLVGYNTDITGFEQSFLAARQPHHDRALILGTGGASVAVQYVLRKQHIPFALVSRQPGYDFPYAELNSEILQAHPILINTTPLGTFPDVHESPELPYGFLTPRHYCYDLVYNPAKTLFLQKAEAQGATIKNGKDMLELQAEANWKIWNG